MGIYKALISDVDGTLITNEKGIIPSDQVVNSVKKAQEKIHIGLSTARPLSLVKDLAESLGLTGPSIVNGGAQIVNLSNGKTLWDQQLVKQDLDIILAKLKKLNIQFVVNDDGIDIEPSKKYVPKKPFSIATFEISPSDADKVLESVSDIPTISAHKFSWQAGKTMGVSINHINATKLHAVLEIARIPKIDRKEIIGVGDSYNDFPLLMACGFKVAMGNAPDDLKAIADYVAPNIDDDGVADVLDKFVLT